MSSFFSRKYQRHLTAQQRVDDDLSCAQCGYNVRGLLYGRACPECGALIEMPAQGDRGSVLTRASTEVRAQMQRGALLCVAGLVLAAPIKLVMLSSLGMIPMEAGLYLTMVAVGLLAVGTWLILPADIDNMHPKLRGVRLLARWGQVLWGPGFLCAWLRTVPYAQTTTADRLVLPDYACRAVAGLAVVCAALVMLRIAEEAFLERAARRFNIVVWVLPILSIFMAATIPSQSMPWIVLFVVAVPTLAWLALLLAFAQGFWDVHAALAWNRRAHAVSLGREGRVAETRAELDAAARSQIRPIASSDGNAPLDGPP